MADNVLLSADAVKEFFAQIFNDLMGEGWLPINSGRQQSSYKEFTIELKPHGIYTLNNPFNYFRCLKSSHNFKVAWSSNQMDTDFEAGLGIKFDSVIPYAQIFNDSDTPLIVSVGVGNGYFDDSRLNVSGIVQTQPAQYASFEASTLTIGEGGSVEIPAAAKIIVQNTGANVMYIGAAGGLQLLPRGTFEFSLGEPLTIYGTAAETIAVGSFN